MSIGYQFEDKNVVDYELWALPGVDQLLRGPRKWNGVRPYLTYLGAAQTFGRFVAEPFPALVARVLDAEYLNFGFAGVGPEFYLGKRAMLDHINRGALCVIQVMSGRSVSTSLLESVKGGGQLKFLTGPRSGKSVMAADAYKILAKEYGPEVLEQQVAEARDQWVSCYNQLLAAISVPKILLWMSTRPLQSDSNESENGLLGEFPHLIGRNEIGRLNLDQTVVCDATVPGPTYMRLQNCFTNAPENVYRSDKFPNHPELAWDINSYYYVQTQHDVVARTLIKMLHSTSLEWS